MRLEKETMAALTAKLADIAGDGKLQAREWRVRCRLNWHNKAPSRIRHIIYGEVRPSLDEAREIEAAYAKWCANRLREIDGETKQLFDSIRQSVAAMEATDPEFFAPTIADVSAALLRCRMQRSDPGTED